MKNTINVKGSHLQCYNGKGGKYTYFENLKSKEICSECERQCQVHKHGDGKVSVYFLPDTHKDERKDIRYKLEEV